MLPDEGLMILEELAKCSEKETEFLELQVIVSVLPVALELGKLYSFCHKQSEEWHAAERTL